MFTTTKINIPKGSVTFYIRKGMITPVAMTNVMKAHDLLALPSKEGGICHALL